MGRAVSLFSTEDQNPKTKDITETMSLSLLANTTTTSSTPFSLRRTKAPPSSTRTSVAKRVSYTSCEQKQQGSRVTDTESGIDRRNVLFGLGGLYGATATLGNMAVGAPIEPPDLSKCHDATHDRTGDAVQCCPPYTSADIIDWTPPDQSTPLRVRKPAHKYDDESLAKFKAAIAKMKALPADDPWNYMQQATIHCTYCNGAYDQVGFDPSVLLQVHESWLFLPWHRYYLYFWERILGKLIDDPTFALPFWNWDSPAGMYMPKIYLDTSSPLYNDKRNHDHFASVLDYNYSYSSENPVDPKPVIIENLKQIYNIFTETINNPALFMGGPVRAGESIPDENAGRLESVHNTIHMWSGPTTSPYEDMGSFYSAARDTLFFGLHANVDRMWDIYSSKRGRKVEFDDSDWLDSSFIFYDENRQVVKVKVKDCLDPLQLRYSYQSEKQPWQDVRRRYLKFKKANKRKADGAVSLTAVSEFGTESRILDSTIRVLVQRPKASRSKDEKEEAAEVLIIDGLKFPRHRAIRFDVYISKPIDDLASSDLGELAGSFVKIAHTHGKTKSEGKHKSSLQMGITNLLEDLNAEGSDKLVVSLVPRDGVVTIGGVHIDLLQSDVAEE